VRHKKRPLLRVVMVPALHCIALYGHLLIVCCHLVFIGLVEMISFQQL
jgi:hypothetical protein